MDTIITELMSWNNVTLLYVILGVVLLGSSTAVVGSFTFLRKKALVGDAIAHAVLPGVGLAFILSEVKHPLVLLLGAFISGWLSILSIDLIAKKSRIKPDAAIGIVLSVFFGVGILILTHIQSTGNAAQAGLDQFLFGQAAALVKADVYVLGIVCIVLLLSVIALFKEFTLLSFDPKYAKSIGLPVRFLTFLLSTLTVLAIAVGIQAVGVVLMAAMLITPAAAARYWTNNLGKMVFLAACFGAVSGTIGSLISYTAPKMPTGPWIIIVLTVIAISSILFAPQRGVLPKWKKALDKKRTTLEENVLKIFFHLGEQAGRWDVIRSIPELQQRRYFSERKLEKALRRLVKKGLVTPDKYGWRLTSQGVVDAKRIAKLHRLWELYLKKYLKIPPDHVHDGAESLEHFFTVDLEMMLEQELDFPLRDPHDSPIPYTKKVK